MSHLCLPLALSLSKGRPELVNGPRYARRGFDRLSLNGVFNAAPLPSARPELAEGSPELVEGSPELAQGSA